MYLERERERKREREREREREGKREPEVKYKGHNNWERRVTWGGGSHNSIILTLATVKNSEITIFSLLGH